MNDVNGERYKQMWSQLEELDTDDCYFQEHGIVNYTIRQNIKL